MQMKSDLEWLTEHITKISELGQKIEDSNPTTDYDSHTALKLIALRYVSDVFTKVARHKNRKIEGFDGAVYVDLFAGTGLVKLKDTGYIVAGSAPCAVASSGGFNHSILVEKDRDKCRYLKERMLKIIQKDDFEVINGDSNKIIQDIINKIKKYDNPIILVFVDPEGMEIKFETLKALSKNFQSCDFLINVNEQGVLRVAGKAKAGIDNIIQSLEEYFNKNEQTVQRELAEGKTPQKQYADQVQRQLDKPIGTNIKIRSSSGKVAYHLLSYTRRTRGGSGYNVNPLNELKQRIERFKEIDVKSVLSQIHGKHTSLDDFYPKAPDP